jgi:hypothetical protein
MLVYGDVECTQTVGAKQARIEALLTEANRLPAGVERHGVLVTAFIHAGELVQGIVDAEFEERGCDARSAAHESGMELLVAMARIVACSWWSGFADATAPASILEELSCFDPRLSIRTKSPEGYAFYAVYPESYLEAARHSGLGPGTQVIGIRSIGTGLSALVAAALDAPPPLTLRPMGRPFRREVRVDPAVTAEFAADKEAAFAIVDEGPGLSGSSFGAVADWLEAAGVARPRIHFFPGHANGLGPQASPDHRERWSAAPRHVVDMDRLLLRSSPPRALTAWIEDILGPLDQPLEEISGGAWRAGRYPDEALWPAANIGHERRKFLARHKGSPWLVKFAGLGEAGLRKHRRAQDLHAAGFTPEVAGYRHGFLIERWHEDGLSLDRTSLDREFLIGRIGSYLGFRARRFEAGRDGGASLEHLGEMARHNARQALGEDAASLDGFPSHGKSLEGRVRRIATDNRMHPWEWLLVGDHLIKTDALDHSAAHDLVGCQDVAWDIAGAAVEFSLSEEEASRLCTIVEGESGFPVMPEILAFLRPCYLAFQMGAHAMAAWSLGDGPEAGRLRRAADRYASLLREHLGLQPSSAASEGTTPTALQLNSQGNPSAAAT